MYGVFTVNNEKIARWLETTPMAKQAAKWMGYEKLERGGQFNNAFAGLIFQFFSWSMAANRKLVASGISGREAHLMSGALAMLSLGMLSDYQLISANLVQPIVYTKLNPKQHFLFKRILHGLKMYKKEGGRLIKSLELHKEITLTQNLT